MSISAASLQKNFHLYDRTLHDLKFRLNALVLDSHMHGTRTHAITDRQQKEHASRYHMIGETRMSNALKIASQVQSSGPGSFAAKV